MLFLLVVLHFIFLIPPNLIAVIFSSFTGKRIFLTTSIYPDFDARNTDSKDYIVLNSGILREVDAEEQEVVCGWPNKN